LPVQIDTEHTTVLCENLLYKVSPNQIANVGSMNRNTFMTPH